MSASYINFFMVRLVNFAEYKFLIRNIFFKRIYLYTDNSMHESKFVNVLTLKSKSLHLSYISIHNCLLLRIIFRPNKFIELLKYF